MKKLFAFVGMIVGLGIIGTGKSLPQLYADTNVSGVISENTVWDTASPYIVIDTVIVDSGVTLDIQPGVEVRIDNAKYIMVKGTLNAIGTATDSIIITKNGTARWSKLWFKSASICSLKYCRIEYASGSAIYNENIDSLYIGYCTISNNSGYFGDGGGIFNSGSATITNNTISNNSASYCGGGIRNHGSATITNNTISNNSASYCGGIYNYGSATITGNTISNNYSAYYGGGGIYNSGSATIRYNTITDTTSYAICLDGSAFIRQNNISATGYAVYNNTGDDIDARYNYWNTTDTAEINNLRIWDLYDDSTKGRVFYQPFLDEAFSDTVAPSAPINLTANGSNPSPVTDDSIFVINWTNPTDPSGISEYYYKLGSEPASDFDTTGTFHSAPDTITVYQEESLYVWLVDSSGNLNYQNRASVMLNYVGIEENSEFRVQSLELKVEPNPVFGNAVIKYGLPEKTSVSLGLYDISGRLVKTVYSGVKGKGYYEANIRGNELSEGVYFIKFEAGNYRDIKKLIIM